MAMHSILRPVQPRASSPRERHVTFNDRPQVIRSRSFHAPPTVSSRAPPSGHADAGSFRGFDGELNRIFRMQTLPHRATIARGKMTDDVIRYLTRKTGCDDGTMFDALCAKQLGRAWVEVRRMAGEREGEQEKAWEAGVRRRLMDEERSWKKADKEGRKRVRARGKRDLEIFVKRFVGIRGRGFSELGGREMGSLCTLAVSVAMKQRQWAGTRIR